MAEIILLSVYLIALLILSLYSFHAYSILYFYLRDRKKRRLAKVNHKTAKELNYYPFVTVQLPIYNEKYVVGRLLESATRLDYPKDRFEIQILDDSTDETTFILSSTVEEYSALGINITFIHRDDRKGFKAGALNEGLKQARGEFVAIFDSDFIIPKEFLQRTIPHFALENVAAVQTRWGHLNREYSILTQGQALALDQHFLFEQDIKCQNGLFINFNGTCGVWRRSAIDAAGGWQDDTLTEDLDLSYRVQLKGYKIAFIPDLVCPGELPVDVNGFKNQQFRWTKGGIEVAKKLLKRVLKSPIPARVKFFAFTHLTSPIVFPTLLLLSTLSLPITLIKIKYSHAILNSLLPAEYLLPQERVIGLYFVLLALFTIFVLPYPILYILSYKRAKKLDGKKDEKKANCYLFSVLLIGGFVALSIFNTLAIAQGLLGRKTDFTRTPKFSITKEKDTMRNKKYVATISPITFFEMAMGLYLLFTLVFSLIHFEFGLAPFLLFYILGFFFLAISSIHQYLEFNYKTEKAVIPANSPDSL